MLRSSKKEEKNERLMFGSEKRMGFVWGKGWCAFLLFVIGSGILDKTFR